MKIFGRYRITNAQIIAFSFLFLILAGTLLLMLPYASREEGSAGFSDCLFTATSAVCVTGLVVRDTVTAWTPFGQAVILLLIQIGGMGVVTTAVCIAFVSGKKIGLMQRSVMQEAISAPQVGGIVRLTKFILLTALVIETLGAAALLPAMVPLYGWKKGLWFSVFHAVSAFCNAGFDLLGAEEPFASMTGFAQSPLVNIVVILLITVGGIGFLVWNDIREHGIHFSRYRLQSKIVLVTSGFLILVPFLWIFLFELPEVPAAQRILPSLFQSVTLRTAGFNTMDLSSVSGSGKTIMILWMLIGGSPGSTAGGMKTTTFAVILVTLSSVIRRKHDIECMGRRISEDTVRSAVAIASIYFLSFFLGGLVISGIERLSLLPCLFETASALGTVGLSLGITGSLGTVSRLVLVSLMFLGRVGSLTLIYAAQSNRRQVQSLRPLEKVTVG